MPQCEHGATKHQNRRTNYFGMARCPILFGIADDAAKSITAVKANLLISQIIDKKTNKKKKHKAKQRNAKTEAKRNRQAKEQTREEEYPSSKRLKR